MNKRILNEVKRNRELMGINESEIDEQGFFRGARDAIKKGYNDAKDFIKDKIGTPIKDTKDALEKYNGKPVDDIIQKIYNSKEENGKRYGKIDVNGETLYYGVGLSEDISIAKSKANSNARIAMANDLGEKTQSDNVTTTTQTQKGVSTVIDKLFQSSNGKYTSYILVKT